MIKTLGNNGIKLLLFLIIILIYLFTYIVKDACMHAKLFNINDIRSKIFKLEFNPVYNEIHLNNGLRRTSKTEHSQDTVAKYFSRNVRAKKINCRAIVHRDNNALQKAKRTSRPSSSFLTANNYVNMTDNCDNFIDNRGYITDHLTEEEKDFPIAYSILMYKNVEQFERLLRAIYRPQNIYCLHVDSKSAIVIYKAVLSIARCFDNVFLLDKRIRVSWGKMSVLTPELLCMKELWERSKTWKYFINLTGQEFPLKTNYELVQILKAYNGSNDVETSVQKRFIDRCKTAEFPPPHGVHVRKGALHIAVNRGYVNYSLHDERAHDILEWTRKACYIPDEIYFSTLNHNAHLGVPGSYGGIPETTRLPLKRKPYLARYKNRVKSITHRYPCHGIVVRGICIYGIGDLPILARRQELFANKFHLNLSPLVFECLEELVYNRTRDEYLGRKKFDATWYSTLGFVTDKM